MRAFIGGITLFSMLGCGDFDLFEETERKPMSPPGIAGMDDVQDVQQVADGGRVEQNRNQQPAQNQQQPQNQGQQAPAGQNDGKGIIGKTTARVVDLHKVMAENPGLVVVENKIRGNDPLTQATSAYISQRSRASMLGMQQSLQHFKVLNERNPTYDEFMQMMKEHRIEFAMLPAYQMYGYDSQEGTIVVIEDRADKARRYEAAGIPLEQ